jgi:antitoxin component YwqK of YwqJK toxin-antitoxin module
LKLGIATTATKLQIGNSSGSITGEVEYVNGEKNDSVSEYQNHSGELRVRLSGWTGFLTAENGSGSKNVGGSGLERWNEGWRKGNGKSTASFRNHSGSLKVEVL